MMTCNIMVTIRREYFHSYPDAPEEVAFLRHPHRHVFHVKLTLPVTHSNREKEFFLVQRWMKASLDHCFGKEGADLGAMSCEDVATELVQQANARYECPAECEVWEDGENGARVISD